MVTPQSPLERAAVLRSVAEAQAPQPAVEWLARGFPVAGEPLKRGLFFGFYAGAARRFGKAAARWTGQQRGQLEAAGVAHPAVWSPGDVLRAALLLAALEASEPGEHVGLIREAIHKGDTGERVATLRALSLLPEPERFVELAVDACRSHVQDVFDAVACHNPYAAQHFPEASFNQLVMKVLFTEVPLSDVDGWQQRTNDELLRMAGDYEAERRAAGRAVPEDIELIRQHSAA